MLQCVDKSYIYNMAIYFRCGGDKFPCGGADNVASVYQSAGPFIYSLTCKVTANAIYINQNFSIELNIHLASLPVSIGNCQ